MSLVRWTGPTFLHIPQPWKASIEVEKESPEINNPRLDRLYRNYLKQFKRFPGDDNAVYLEVGATVYRGGETQEYDVEFTGAPTYKGAFFGDLSVAGKYYLQPGSAQPGSAPRSVAEMTLLRQLRLFPMTYTNLKRLHTAIWENKDSFDGETFRKLTSTVPKVMEYGVKGGLQTNVDFGQLISTVETTLGKYDGFAFYRAFFEPEETEEGKESRRIFGMNPKRSNEQCFVGEAKDTFLKSPYVFTSPDVDFFEFPNFWGARFPAHPIFDKRARPYLSRKSWARNDDELSSVGYHSQFIFPTPELPMGDYDAHSEDQYYTMLEEGSIVYQAKGNSKIFSDKSTAQRRALQWGRDIQKLVTAKRLFLVVLCQAFFDFARTLIYSWHTHDEVREIIQILDMHERHGIIDDKLSAKLAFFIASEVMIGAQGFVNTPRPTRELKKNRFGVDVNRLLRDQPCEVHLADATGVLEVPRGRYESLVYADDDPRGQRTRAEPVRFSPY